MSPETRAAIKAFRADYENTKLHLYLKVRRHSQAVEARLARIEALLDLEEPPARLPGEAKS